MLINDLEYFEHSSSYHKKYSGMDNPHQSRNSLGYFLEYPIKDFDYKFNSWGFRGPEYDQYIGQPVNICLGDSFTVNVGGPVEHSWVSQLAEHFDIPTVNLGMDGAGNDAIKLVYNRACEVFDVQDTFVMYSYLHRRLIDAKFKHEIVTDLKNYKYFLEQRLLDAFECALPSWNFTENENGMFGILEIYLVKENFEYFTEHQELDRRFICGKVYNDLRGTDWPTLEQFIQGAEPHPDMLTKEFGQFVSVYKNRDGWHMSYNANKIYADYLYQQWRQENES